MNIGYIKLHRDLLHWEYYDDIKATRLLIHLLCVVNYEDKKWHGIIISKGSMVLSWATLSAGSSLSIQQCRTAMKKLESSGEVTRKLTGKWQVVTLVKWEKFQDSSIIANSEPNRERTGKEQGANKEPNREITPTKEDKKIRNKETKKENTKENFNFRKSLEGLGIEKKLVEDFLKNRKTKKLTNTETAFNGLEREFEKTGVPINELFKAIVENGWGSFKNSWNWNNLPTLRHNESEGMREIKEKVQEKLKKLDG